MYFYGLILGPPDAGSSWNLEPCLNKLGKGALGTKFQATKPSGSEEEDFLNIFLCISMA